MENVIKIKKNNLYFGLVSVLLVLLMILFFSDLKLGISEEVINQDFVNLETKFAMLNRANSNSCGGTFDFVDSKLDEDRIQGSCCGAMNFHRYTEQIQGLKKYSIYDKIPSDPYDVPADLAKELLEYQKNIVLTSQQQEFYNQAMSLSDEGGPCCCKCWHWYAYEGLAKYLIIEMEFTAEQIAEVWDLSDACGGSGHIEGVHSHG